jgi:hypothetical protein
VIGPRGAPSVNSRGLPWRNAWRTSSEMASATRGVEGRMQVPGRLKSRAPTTNYKGCRASIRHPRSAGSGGRSGGVRAKINTVRVVVHDNDGIRPKAFWKCWNGVGGKGIRRRGGRAGQEGCVCLLTINWGLWSVGSKGIAFTWLGWCI